MALSKPGFPVSSEYRISSQARENHGLPNAMTVERALKDLNVTNLLVHTLNGEEALEHLINDDNKKPCVILLDLNMPRMNGFEFLEAIKSNPQWRRIPVIILTTSKNHHDRIGSFDLQVSGYMIKPVDYMQFVEVIRVIDTYWTLSETGY